jgi:ABC-2 type transport system permease protein
MITTLNHYAGVVRQLIILSQESAFEYRTDYILRLVRAVTDILVVIVVIQSLYIHTSSIAGFSRAEALIVYALYQMITSTVLIFFGYGIDDLPRLILTGKLDMHLTKPIDSQFLAGANIIYITHIYRAITGLMVFIYAINLEPLTITISSLMLTSVSLVAAGVIFYSLSMGVSILSFWTFSNELQELSYTITSTSRLPTAFFPPVIQKIFLIIPLAFIATIPSLALLNKNILLPAISPLVALITFYLTRRLWHKGLQSYQSASS